ncbi:MAG TPA: glycerol dehydrogenase [Syntrophomonadaceae bacterium]|nr:glycerol dehydrogenase [Syntrophomonadaceae bacterium]HQE23446.1 glycerol dehydrogenase [Syntrophomonadaceae bacterium]
MAIAIAAFPGRYLQGPGVLRHASAEISKYGTEVLLVSDPYVAKNIWPVYAEIFQQELSIHMVAFGGECCVEEINKTAAQAVDASCDIIVALGGGKTIDAAKAVAYYLNLPVIIIPTAASTDAPCSAVSVVYEPDGRVKTVLKLKSNPQAVIMDTEIIAQAPVRLLVSGMGDALATWFEADSVWRTQQNNTLGAHPLRTAHSLARLCYDTIAQYGILAKQACEQGIVTPALEYVVEANTLLSGIGFESGGLGASHAIHNGLTVLEGTHHYLHGEKVAYGLLSSLFLTGRSPHLIKELYQLFGELGLPTRLRDIGLSGVSREELMPAAQAACNPGSNIYHEAGEINPPRVCDAMLAADAYGQSFK